MTPRQSRRAPAQSVNERNEELVRLAQDIVGNRIPRTKIERAVEYTQSMKTTKKSAWSDRLRYGFVITARHRDTAERIATALSSLRVALRKSDTLFRHHLGLLNESDEIVEFPLDSVAIEKWLRHFRKIADTKVRAGSPFDARKLVAAQQAAILLEAAGLPLNLTRSGKFEALAAVLWGEPDADFLRPCTKFRDRFRRERSST
jgi:hypothetical protein